jgi:uncharacterized protein YjiS (DUF1127 family)
MTLLAAEPRRNTEGKTTMTYTTRPRPAPGSPETYPLPLISGALTWLSYAIDAEFRRRRTERNLNLLDDRTLRDIGLVRSEIGYAARNEPRR